MNRYICHACRTEFAQQDFSDDIWRLFCSMRCVFAWSRREMQRLRPAEPPSVEEAE